MPPKSRIPVPLTCKKKIFISFEPQYSVLINFFDLFIFQHKNDALVRYVQSAGVFEFPFNIPNVLYFISKKNTLEKLCIIFNYLKFAKEFKLT